MNIPRKAIIVMGVLAALTLGALWVQRSASMPRTVKITKEDMELFVSAIPAAQLREIQSSPDEKKHLVEQLKEVIAVGQAAELAGYADKPEVKADVTFQIDQILYNAYTKKHPGAKATPDEITAYNQRNPNDFEAFMQSRPAQVQQRAQGPQREQFRQAFGEVKVIADKARKEKLDKDRETELEIMVGRDNLLAEAYVKDLQDSDKLVSEADIQKYYNQHLDEFEEVRARHILIGTKAQAEESDDTDSDEAPKKTLDAKGLSKEEAQKKAESILDRVHKGEDFAKLAQENSDDPGSKTSGGDLGYFGRGKMVPVFEQTAFALKPGEVSGVVESQFGYHIIKVEDHRTPASSDPKVQQEIIGKLKQDKVKEKVDSIVNNSKVQIAEDFNVPEAPALPPGHGAPGPATAPPGHPQVDQ
jgi:peptidyl-prolyl cis-trans isomerase C